jgi:hypothetical protein
MCEVVLLNDLSDMLLATMSPLGEPALLKEVIGALQRHVGRFGEEQVHDRSNHSVGAEKEDICLPADVVDGNGRDFDDDEVADPEGGRRTGRTPLADTQSADLGSVQPWSGQPTPGKERIEPINASAPHTIEPLPNQNQKTHVNRQAQATYPAALLPSLTQIASTSIEIAWPTDPVIINCLLPTLSIIQMGISDAKRYSVALNPAMRSDRSRLSPIDWKITAA